MAAPGAPPPGQDPASTTAILLVVCAALIAVGALSKEWMTAGKHYTEAHFGPLGMQKTWDDAPSLDVPRAAAVRDDADLADEPAATATGAIDRRQVASAPRLVVSATTTRETLPWCSDCYGVSCSPPPLAAWSCTHSRPRPPPHRRSRPT